jgi:uncharacterized protein
MEKTDKSGGFEHKAGVDPRLLELLVCPLTKTSLDYDAKRQELISRVARLAFPIRDGVPMMTVEAARHLDDPIDAPPVDKS